jgi:predicted transposase YdaD
MTKVKKTANPVGRPKSEATRIKELETRIEELESELKGAMHVANEAREKPLRMEGLFFNIHMLLEHVYENYDSMDEGLVLSQIRAAGCMAEAGSNMAW